MNLSNFYAFSLTGELGESITKESVITLRKRRSKMVFMISTQKF